MKEATSQEKIYHQAYQSRDARFDGKFFLAVKTTGIYCRPICPAKTPLKKNVLFFKYAYQAANAGFRPCLRCHPDSAPGSPAWNGIGTTLTRAKRLIDNGALETGSVESLSTQLGISDRYLRQLFNKHLGISPKAYSLFKQCEFAKNLLHQTRLPITQIALASGFNSLRRFNDCFRKQFSLTPSVVRNAPENANKGIRLKLYFRPTYNWEHFHNFLDTRKIEGLEWLDKHEYGRTFYWNTSTTNDDISETSVCKGCFTAHYNGSKHCFEIDIEIDNLLLLKPVVNNIRRILDLDTDSETIEQCLASNGLNRLEKGLRLPGTWSVFEAGIRAILGQQISVVAARNLVKTLVSELGEKQGERLFFPTPDAITKSSLAFLKMPGKRKETVKALARHFLTSDSPENPQTWLSIKGIGPWTIDYAKMRGLSDPDIYLGGDLGVKKALCQAGIRTDPDSAAPFRSYLTFQLWNQL